MRKDKRITFTDDQVKAAQEECGHRLEKLDRVSDAGAKAIGTYLVIFFWVGLFGHIWGFFIFGWIALFVFTIVLKPFSASAEKKEYLACCKYRRWDLIRSGCIFDPVTGEKLQ